jgi:serine phosphatase RsbU (regulator of sigma subunit)
LFRTIFSFRGLVFAFALVAIGLPVALLGELGIVRTLNALNTNVARIREGQLAAAAILQAQIDEQTGILGYAATGLRPFLAPFETGRARLPAAFDQLEDRLRDAHADGPDERGLRELRQINADWRHEVADPVLAGRPLDRGRALRGKQLVDRFRSLIAPIGETLAARYRAGAAQRAQLLRVGMFSAIAAIGLIAILVGISGVALARLRRELDQDRAVVEALQNAVSTRLVPPPHLRIGTAYRSATRGARVGGDVYDVYRLDDDCTLIVVADVSGKGLTAAVDAMFVRFALRALASEAPVPDEVVQRFDRLYRDAGGTPESFVTLFVGVHDRRTETLTYANAGHEACWIRRGRELTMLAPTGALIGVGPSAFGAATTPLGPGDLLVLATDGLTEARDPKGGFIDLARVTGWLIEADPSDPQKYIDEILERVAAYTRRGITDDLAVLAVAPI